MKPHHFKYDISGDIAKVIIRLDLDVHLFNNKTILITGGTGFFGRWLLQILCTLILERGFRINIFVLSRNPKKFLDGNLECHFEKYINFINGDVTNFELPRVDFDYLIHMATTAALETYNGEDQLQKLELLYKGTRNTLEASIARGVKKVLFTSSGVAYGPSVGVPFTEEMLQAPQTINVSSALGEGKRLAEYLVSYYALKGDFEFSIARCFSFFGPFLPLGIHYAIGNFVNDALLKNEITVKGSGQELRSYLYIADAWVWLLKLLVHADNEIYNVGSSQAISIGNLATLVRDLVAPEKEVRFLSLAHDVGNFSRNTYVPNNDKIINRLNLSEWTSLRDGVKKMASI
jgi:dTDP-glucose 4,6-dehydratase/UDP-glucose 4-epimerase